MKKLLIIRLDAIGDYVLFRNFLEFLRKSPQYQSYQITLTGNALWKDMAENYDKPFVDKFIWLEKPKFSKNRWYRWYFYIKLWQKKYDVIINPTFSRNFFFDDDIIKHCRANIKIAHQTDQSNIHIDKLKISNQFYTQFIDTGQEPLFEFHRNKLFFESLLNVKIDLEKPYFSINSKPVNVPKYIILFPSASEKHKQWASQNFIELANKILTNYPFKIYLAGSLGDFQLNEDIKNSLVSEQVINLAGQTSLPDLVDLINESALLISNDTATIHIAGAVNTPTICIYKGDHYGRFQPYPSDISKIIYTIMPDSINSQTIDSKEFIQKYQFKSPEDINQISVEKVWIKTKEILDNV